MGTGSGSGSGSAGTCALRSDTTTTATAATTIAPPARIGTVMASDRISQPRKTATTGLTKAYVATSEMGAAPSTQTYAVKATTEPNVTRYPHASHASSGAAVGSRCSPRMPPSSASHPAPNSIS